MLARPIQVIVRLNKDELQKLKRYSAKAGYTQSAYLRSLLNKTVPREKPDERFYEFMRQIAALGNSMNQIARKANAIGFIDAPYYKQQAELVAKFELDVYERFMSPERVP
jgi:hypothetical protein